MSLLLAEYFLTLADTCQKIADEISEGAALSHPAQTGEVSTETTETETTEAKVAADKAETEAAVAAEKKKQAAAKRRAAAKAKKEKEAAAEAEVEVEEEVDVDELLATAQDYTRKLLKTIGTEDTRAILNSCDVNKVSEAKGDAAKLKEIISNLTAAHEASDQA